LSANKGACEFSLHLGDYGFQPKVGSGEKDPLKFLKASDAEAGGAGPE
jgi:hypothetical protein